MVGPCMTLRASTALNFAPWQGSLHRLLHAAATPWVLAPSEQTVDAHRVVPMPREGVPLSCVGVAVKGGIISMSHDVAEATPWYDYTRDTPGRSWGSGEDLRWGMCGCGCGILLEWVEGRAQKCQLITITVCLLLPLRLVWLGKHVPSL